MPGWATNSARVGNGSACSPPDRVGSVAVVEHDRLERDAAAPRQSARATAGSASGPGRAMLALQRTAGNAAVTSMIGVQRDGIGDDLFGPNPFGGPGPQTAEGDGGPPAPAEPPSGINELGPVARTGTLIADSIIASSYSPGAGNIF